MAFVYWIHLPEHTDVTKDQLRSMHREFQAGWCPDKDDLFLSWILANNKDKNG